ncbi:hypothetical protein GCM10010448_12830 [Streptomyces glomeratus]|uniref:Uncharacterized protein n=1 Tax=Streptomyces glomeratus TaxID=284452 RepID=A0ABP6L490_9ACTN
MDITAGGLAEAATVGLGGAAKAVAGAASERDNTAAEVIGRRRPAIFFKTDTDANVPGARR